MDLLANYGSSDESLDSKRKEDHVTMDKESNNVVSYMNADNEEGGKSKFEEVEDLNKNENGLSSPQRVPSTTPILIGIAAMDKSYERYISLYVKFYNYNYNLDFKFELTATQ